MDKQGRKPEKESQNKDFGAVSQTDLQAEFSYVCGAGYIILGWTQEGHARRSESQRKTKNYLERDCRETAKQSRVEEPRGRAGK